MPFDGLVLAAIQHELTQKIMGSKIDKIYQPAPEEIHLLLHKPEGRSRLLLSANASMARIHWTNKTKENPSNPPAFCMVLRKHLEGGRIVSIQQTGLDRILHIQIDTRDELGRNAIKTLVCEFMGKHSNLLLINEQQEIIDGIKRYSHALSRHREVLPGRPYIAPPAQHKQNPLHLDEEQFCNLMLENDLAQKVCQIIQKEFEGLSPFMATEVIHRAKLTPDTPLEVCGTYELRSLWLALQEIMRLTENQQFSPTLVVTKKNKPLEFAAFSLTMYESHKAITGLMNDLVDAYFYQKQQKERLEKEKHTLGGNLRKDISRLKKKLAIQQESIRNAEEREQYRIAGDLITANIYRLQKGDTKAMLEDFHQPNTPLVTISLDPHLTPAENAQKQYKRYNKAKHTLEAAQKQAQMTNEELQYLLGIESALMLAENVEEIKQIHQEMIGQGYAKPIIIPGKKQKKVRDIPRPLAFCSSTGFPIWVGKNNRQNDYLTMKMAQDNDIWLHTKDIPGAHVIISAANGTPDETSIHEAASLAAYFSKARNSSKVPVDYTLRKYVNKPSGAKPGYVIYTDQKTIYADPQEELEETLASSESF